MYKSKQFGEAYHVHCPVGIVNNSYLKLFIIGPMMCFINYLLQLVQKNKFDLLNINLICKVINRNCMSI